MGIDLKERWREQKETAKTRGIKFRLTYEQWLGIWKRSGKLHLRGQRRGQYVMGRHGDKGAYEVGNVSIISNYENNAPGRAALLLTARLTNDKASEAQRRARAKGQEACVRANTGAKRSAETRAKMSKAAKLRDPKTRKGGRGFGWHHDPKVIAKISASNKLAWARRLEAGS